MSEITLDLEEVKNWVWETNYGGRKVPAMSEEEQAVHRELDAKKRAGEYMPRDQFMLWSALDRKVQYRHKQNYSEKRVDWAKRNLERARSKYGRIS